MSFERWNNLVKQYGQQTPKHQTKGGDKDNGTEKTKHTTFSMPGRT